MRVSTAFNRLLQIPGAWVTDVVIAARDVEVTPRPKARRLQCPCGCWSRRFMTGGGAAGDIWTWADADYGWSMRSVGWIARTAGGRTEELPWARPGAGHTRDFEDMVLWLAQRTDRTSVAHLDALRLGNRHRSGVGEIYCATT